MKFEDDDLLEMVYDFAKLAGNVELPPFPQLPRAKDRNLVCYLLREEVEETANAHWDRDFREYIDGLADTLFVCMFGLLNCGIDPVIALDEVAKSNLTKFRPGYQHRDDGKLVKSPSYVPADMGRVIELCGGEL